MPDPIEPVEPEVEEPEEPETPDDETPEDETPEPGEDALGDPGKRALEATKAKWKAERNKRISLEQQLLDAKKPKDAPADPDAIRDEIRREVRAEANAQIISARVEAAAATVLHNPADASAFLDLTQFEVDDKGHIDADDIKSALQDLIDERPYLAIEKTNPQRDSKKRIPEVPADPANKTSTPVSHADKVKAAKAAGDWAAVIALENDLLEQKK